MIFTITTGDLPKETDIIPIGAECDVNIANVVADHDVVWTFLALFYTYSVSVSDNELSTNGHTVFLSYKQMTRRETQSKPCSGAPVWDHMFIR